MNPGKADAPRPFFERAGSPHQDLRRLLLVAQSFPPDEVVGSRRWAKMAHFAAARGWGLDVITRTPEHVSPAGQSALEALPGGVRVFAAGGDRTLAIDYADRFAFKTYRAIRDAMSPRQTGADDSGGNVPRNSRPDAIMRDDIHWSLSPRTALRTFWVLRDRLRFRDWSERVTQFARDLVDPRVHRVVIASGPPTWTYDAARRIAARAHLPFVMDMRDPWSLMERVPEFYASPLWFSLAHSTERRCVDSAALVVGNTELARRALIAEYPHAARKTIAVLNGSDDDPVPPPAHGPKFTIAFAGTVYVHDHVRTLFRAARRVATELGLTPAEFGIEMIGDSDGLAGSAPAAEIAKQEDFAAYVTVGGRKPHPEALRLLARAAMLVAFPAFDVISIPAKVYECARFDAWFLALCEEDSATDLLLRDTKADVVRPRDLEGITAAIRTRAIAYLRDGVRPTRTVEDDRLSRSAQARILLNAIEQLDRRSVHLTPQGSFRQIPAEIAWRPPRISSSGPRPRIRLSISIDTEEDNWGAVRNGITTRNVLELPKLASLFERLGVRPTYFTTYQVAAASSSAAVLRELFSTGTCEIGAHLHPWNTPPVVGLEDSVSMLMRYPPDAQAKKLESLLAILHDRIGVEPTAFRAGRFGFDASTIAALVGSGILVDSSVTPLVSWEAQDGPSFLRAPNEPFQLFVRGAAGPGKGTEVIEVPVTVGYTGFAPRAWGRLASLVHGQIARRLHVAGIASRIGLFRRVILSPETNDTEEMLDVSRRLVSHGAEHLHMFFHSSSLVAGLTPFSRSQADVTALYERIERYVDELHRIADVAFCTVSEAAMLSDSSRGYVPESRGTAALLRT